uniref:Protein kinase domain-containing protein n=1 Tax=Ganoderma boninense TaxID=34458 RepID=A0A5K1K7T4_9APHY|nr:Protein kinase domain-containing protein [Ganoderma boninense]
MSASPENSFSSIPILDWSLLATTDGHANFVQQLRHALVNVGFLYLSNPPVARQDMDALVTYTPKLFDLPREEKERITMANSPHFFGYSRLDAELTKGRTDHREQFDFGTPYENQWSTGDPEYLKLWGPPQASARSSLEQCRLSDRNSIVALGAVFAWI